MRRRCVVGLARAVKGQHVGRTIMRTARAFAQLASVVAKAAGRPATFAAAFVIILAWGVSGPLLGFSDTWQLLMNSISSVVTFLMVFLIQNTQARDSEAMNAKLDTLVAAVARADQRYIGVEQLPDQEIEQMRERLGPHPPARE